MSPKDDGYGKIILLGEHFVVHGLPALVTALDLATNATITQAPDNLTPIKIIDNRPKVPTYQPLKESAYNNMVKAVFTALNIEPTGWIVTFSGSLPVTNGGIGASAAAAVALARAINNRFKLNCSEKEINQAAHAGEKEVHGKPSGIDDTAATTGGTFVFTQEQVQHVPPLPLYMVIADSGRPTNTKKAIEAVQRFKLQDPHTVKKLFDRYAQLFQHALDAYTNADIQTFGKTLTANHRLLQELGVSSRELDYLVAQALQNGALGAKLTGSGCGGLMIALAPSQHIQTIITHKLRAAGFFTLPQNINFAQ